MEFNCEIYRDRLKYMFNRRSLDVFQCNLYIIYIVVIIECPRLIQDDLQFKSDICVTKWPSTQLKTEYFSWLFCIKGEKLATIYKEVFNKDRTTKACRRACTRWLRRQSYEQKILE